MFADQDEQAFVADQLAEVHDAFGRDERARAARLLMALDAEAPNARAVDGVLTVAAERLAGQASGGDEHARVELAALVELAVRRGRPLE